MSYQSTKPKTQGGNQPIYSTVDLSKVTHIRRNATSQAFEASQDNGATWVEMSPAELAALIVIYDGTASGLNASNVQLAIDLLQSNKLDKIKTPLAGAVRLYGIAANGAQGVYLVAQGSAENDSIVRRTNVGGNIFTGDATSDGHATNKKFVVDYVGNLLGSLNEILESRLNGGA